MFFFIEVDSVGSEMLMIVVDDADIIILHVY